RIFEGLPVAAAKTDECRHDLHTFGRSVVPEMKAFAPMRRFDQSDACAPPKHVICPRPIPAPHLLLCHPQYRSFNLRLSRQRHSTTCAENAALLIVTKARPINWTLDELFAVARRRWHGQTDPASGHAGGIDPYLARGNRDRSFAPQFQSRKHRRIPKIYSAI